VWLRPTPIPWEAPEETLGPAPEETLGPAPEETPVREITGVDDAVPFEELLVPVDPTEETLPTTLMLDPEEPDPVPAGGPEGWLAPVPGPVTVPEPPTTVVTVPTGLLEPEVPLPDPVLTTGTGTEATGVGVVGEGVVVPDPVVPPEVGLDAPVPGLGLLATGREMDAGLGARWVTWVAAERRPPPGDALAATVVAWAVPRETACGLTTATAARPRDVEREPAFGCAVSVWVAGEPMAPSLGQPLKATTALPSTNSIEAASTRVPAVPRPAR
jgi:hypothetical protein